MDWAWDAPAYVPSGALFVLVVLGDHGNDHSGEDWACYPAVERIMKRTHLSRATVERHLQWLFDEGFISRRRKVRKDGKLGVYEYVLHREDGTRERLKADRTGVQPAPEGSDPAADPCCNLQHGPCGDLSETMLQNEGKPCRKLQHEEPLVEPLVKPKTGAREPGDEGFDEALSAFPELGQKRTDVPLARSAWAWACTLVEPERLLAAIRRFTAEDGDVRKGVCPSLQRWLSGERWRYWLGEDPSTGTAETVRTGFAGPAALRAKIVAAKGEGFAVSYLDRSPWNDATQVIAPWSGHAAEQLRTVEDIIRSFGATLGQPTPPVARVLGGTS